MRVLLASSAFLASCVAPVSFPLPAAPPETRTTIMVGERGDQTPTVIVRDSAFEERLVFGDDLRWSALYYRCSPEELGLNDGSAPKPLPATRAAHQFVEGQWRAMAEGEVNAARGLAELPHPDVPCANLQIDEEQVGELEEDFDIRTGAWLDPDRGEVVALDAWGRLWRGSPGSTPYLWDVTSSVDLRVIAYSLEHRALFGGAIDRTTLRWMTVRITREEGLQVLAESPDPLDPGMGSGSLRQRLAFAPGEPLEMYHLSHQGTVTEFRAGTWREVRAGKFNSLATDLVVLDRGLLLVLGRCESPLGEPGTEDLGCDRSVAELRRDSNDVWSEVHRPTPVGAVMTSMALAGDGTVYIGTNHGELYARGQGENAWLEIEATDSNDGVERLTAFEDGVLAGLDNSRLHRVRGRLAERCPSVRARAEQRGLVTWGPRFALIGPITGSPTFTFVFGQARDFDCRLPSLVQTE